ncbi:TIGR00270 family protein [Candidatus Woesearchaeota archaeon]|nr:TIGR00270 family protein [Candidatus Woesearchaeota archaeon]
MSSCELCGKEANLKITIIENATLKVCNNCSKYGKAIYQNPINNIKKQKNFRHQEPIEELVEDYAKIIKAKREKLGLSQKDFSFKLNEKESILLKIENGGIKPNLDLVKKIQKFLNINLIYKEESSILGIKQKSSKEGMTIGDFIKK